MVKNIFRKSFYKNVDKGKKKKKQERRYVNVHEEISSYDSDKEASDESDINSSDEITSGEV